MGGDKEGKKQTKATTLTKQDIRMMKFFQHDKGDVSLWPGWRENKKLLKRDLREVWKAHKAARDASMFLNLAIDRLDEDDYPNEEKIREEGGDFPHETKLSDSCS